MNLNSIHEDNFYLIFSKLDIKTKKALSQVDSRLNMLVVMSLFYKEGNHRGFLALSDKAAELIKTYTQKNDVPQFFPKLCELLTEKVIFFRDHGEQLRSLLIVKEKFVEAQVLWKNKLKPVDNKIQPSPKVKSLISVIGESVDNQVDEIERQIYNKIRLLEYNLPKVFRLSCLFSFFRSQSLNKVTHKE